MMQHAVPEAAHRAAAHCDALLRRRAAPAERVPELEGFGERAAAALARAVAQAWGDPLVEVVRGETHRFNPAGCATECGSPAAVSVHAFGKAGRALAILIEGRALLEQLDRTFGGTGDIGDDLPQELSRSADLLARRLESQVAAVIASELGGIELQGTARGSDAAALLPFAADATLVALEFQILGSDRRPMRMMIAVEIDALDDLLPRNTATRPATRTPRKASIGDAPFADLPLGASATLVDMAVPLSRLARLEPGTVLPITVARSVPLKFGEIAVARGTVGEVDDQVALQITQTFSGKDPQ